MRNDVKHRVFSLGRVAALASNTLLELTRQTFDTLLAKYPRLASITQTWSQDLDTQVLQNITVEEAA